MMHAGRRRQRVALVLVVGAVALAGCNSKSTPGTSATASAGASAPAGSGSGQAGQLNALSSSVQAGKQSTFKAVYTENSTTSTVTVEQKPPKSLFISGGVTFIDDGTASYTCEKSGGTPTCVSYAGGGFNPVVGLQQLFNPDLAANFYQQAATQLGAKAAGYNVSISTETFAGQDATCASVSGAGQSGRYCVTRSGILAYLGSAASHFSLSDFSTSVPDSDFELPAGASPVTAPS